MPLTVNVAVSALTGEAFTRQYTKYGSTDQFLVM